MESDDDIGNLRPKCKNYFEVLECLSKMKISPWIQTIDCYHLHKNFLNQLQKLTF